MNNEVHEIQYITGAELAKRLSVAPKTISNNTYKIVGRAKIGGAVRYNWNKIKYNLDMGKNLYGGGGQV